MRNFDARARGNSNRSSNQESTGIEWRTCHQRKEKDQCLNGDQCSFWHESNDRAQKLDHTAATPSEPSMSRGRSVSKKRCIQGKSNHGAILRQLCRYYLRGACTRWPCEYWHPPECQFYTTETGCKAGNKCLFPYHKVDEQPNKKPKKGHNSHKTRESDEKNAVAIVKIVPQSGCVSQDSDALVSQRGKQSQGNPMQKVLGTNSKSTVHSVYATSREYPGKGRTIAWKTNVKVPHQRSLHDMKFENWS